MRSNENRRREFMASAAAAFAPLAAENIAALRSEIKGRPEELGGGNAVFIAACLAYARIEDSLELLLAGAPYIDGRPYGESAAEYIEKAIFEPSGDYRGPANDIAAIEGRAILNKDPLATEEAAVRLLMPLKHKFRKPDPVILNAIYRNIGIAGAKAIRDTFIDEIDPPGDKENIWAVSIQRPNAISVERRIYRTSYGAKAAFGTCLDEWYEGCGKDPAAYLARKPDGAVSFRYPPENISPYPDTVIRMRKAQIT